MLAEHEASTNANSASVMAEGRCTVVWTALLDMTWSWLKSNGAYLSSSSKAEVEVAVVRLRGLLLRLCLCFCTRNFAVRCREEWRGQTSDRAHLFGGVGARLSRIQCRAVVVNGRFGFAFAR